MKILLAEDDFVTRKFMASFLSKYGECDVTVDGMEAVDAFMLALEEGEPYDLVCLDIMMPVMDGLQATSAIRNLNKPGAHSIPIIAMTANAFKYFFKYPLGIEINLKGIFLLSDIQGRVW